MTQLNTEMLPKSRIRWPFGRTTSPSISGTTLTSCAGCWRTTIALGLVNCFLICLTGDRRFKKVHFSWLCAYAGAASFVFPNRSWMLFPTSIVHQPRHFGVLIRARRRFRSRRKVDSPVLRSNRQGRGPGLPRPPGVGRATTHLYPCHFEARLGQERLGHLGQPR